MAIDPNSELFKAILSMDSYNRGYNAGLVIAGTDIGSASILQKTVDGQLVNVDSSLLGTTTDENGNTVNKDMADGFYAIAYQLPDDSVTISYRGTDQVWK